MLEVVWLTGLDRVLPGGYYSREVVRMDGVGAAPLLQFFERPAKVLKDSAIDVLDAASRRHDRDQAGKRVDDQPEAVLAGADSQCFRLARAWVG